MSRFDDGPPAVSALEEISLLRHAVQLAVLGGGSALVLGRLAFATPWAWPAMAAGGCALAVGLGLLARWALVRVFRRLDDGALPGGATVAFGAAGVLWGTGLQALAAVCLDAGAALGEALGPFTRELVVGLPWEVPAGLGFAAWGWLHGTSVRERWPTWDLVFFGIVAVVLVFAPSALGWGVARIVALVVYGVPVRAED